LAWKQAIKDRHAVQVACQTGAMDSWNSWAQDTHASTLLNGACPIRQFANQRIALALALVPFCSIINQVENNLFTNKVQIGRGKHGAARNAANPRPAVVYVPISTITLQFLGLKKSNSE
jgi:hypothetical protein